MSKQSRQAALDQSFKEYETLVTEEEVYKLLSVSLASIRRWRLERRDRSS
jgi:hypothetical protein